LSHQLSVADLFSAGRDRRGTMQTRHIPEAAR